MTPLDRDEAKRRIVALIVAGELPPFAQVSERSLAERTGLGRTPVREALRDLERDGVIEISPKRGSIVRRLGLDDVREIFEVRFALESLAAALAAQRGAGDRLRCIHDAFAAQGGGEFSPGELSAYRDLGHDLHVEVIASARNWLLTRQYAQVRLMIELSLSLTEAWEEGRVRATIGEHLSISSAILAGDPAAAQAAMQAHLRAGHAERLRILTDLPALDARPAAGTGRPGWPPGAATRGALQQGEPV